MLPAFRNLHLGKGFLTNVFFPLAATALLVASAATSAVASADVSDDDNLQYIIVLDAGSTGTRLNAYKFRWDDSHSTGLKILELRDKKITPGLSAYKNFPGRLRGPLGGLLRFAASYVPPRYHSNTTAVIRATAGLRLLSARDRAAVSRVAIEVLRRSPFLVPEADDRALRVITGREEAEYGWVSVNFLLDTFDQTAAEGSTVGMLDMGGGSTQITFVPSVDDVEDNYRIVFQTVHGRNYALHQHSYLGLGMSQAILTMLGHNTGAQQQESSLPTRYVSPCLSPDFSGTFSFGSVSVNVTGHPDTSPDERLSYCMSAAQRALRLGGVHQPPGIKHAKFVAVSSFYYVANQLTSSDPGWRVAVPGNVTVRDLSQAASRMCASPPSEGKYAPYLCLNLAHLVTLLREGYRFSPDQALHVTDTINGYSAGWSLGLAIHYLTCHDPVIVRCLVPSASRASAAANPDLWSLAVAAAEFLVPLAVNSMG